MRVDAYVRTGYHSKLLVHEVTAVCAHARVFVIAHMHAHVCVHARVCGTSLLNFGDINNENFKRFLIS